jgi:hypothetical protein
MGGWWPSRYGPDDQAGALNEITPEVVRQAVTLVRHGPVYDLAHVLHQDVPAFPGPHLPAVSDHQLPPDQPPRAGCRAREPRARQRQLDRRAGALERTRAFRRMRNWRVGIEARISHLKRAFGLRRTRLRRLGGARTWVGLGIFAYTCNG